MLQIRRDTVEFDPKLAALLSLLREYTRDVGNVSDATWEAALNAGWSDEELTDCPCT